MNPDPGLYRRIYTLCRRMIPDSDTAVRLAVEALADADPYKKAVLLLLDRESDTVPVAEAGQGLEGAIQTLPYRPRLVLLLLDVLGISPEKAALWMLLSPGELYRLRSYAQLLLAKASKKQI